MLKINHLTSHTSRMTTIGYGGGNNEIGKREESAKIGRKAPIRYNPSTGTYLR